VRRLDRGLFNELPSNHLPERVLQFGTGGFLRGFIGHFIEEANRQHLFDGRIVAVGSTGSGRDRALNEQDGLFTLWVRGLEDGVALSDFRLNSACSRALSADEQWPEVLECARSGDLELICSNTTEAGIALDDSDALDGVPPRSFPAKLTRVLWERARHFDFARERGVVVLPCELIEDNGTKLKQLVTTLAQRWRLDPRFTRWLDEAVPFCNTLVDRIVPGAPAPDAREKAWLGLGYRDDLLTVAEPYRLFAIEADQETAARLRFAKADPAIVISEDIAPYRLRKVRLLNGAHTIMVPLALLSGCVTVADAVNDARVGAFLRHVLLQELVPSVEADGAAAFAHHVLERFANPFIRHELIDITLQQTAKMRVRVVPSILDYAHRFGSAPRFVAFGFAAFLLYMRDGLVARPDAHAEQVRDYLAPASHAGGRCARCGERRTALGARPERSARLYGRGKRGARHSGE
jgi:tagaturonate reductase